MPDQTCSQEEWEYVMWMYSAQAEGAIRQFMSPAFRILSSAITSAVAPTDWGECLRVLVVPGLPVSDLEVSAECLRDAVREEGIVVRTVYDSSEDTSSPHSFDLSSPSLDPEIPTCLVTSATTADECCKFEKLLAYISMLNPIPRNSGMRRLCVVVVCSEMSVYLNTVLSGDERRNFYPVVHHVEDTSDQLADTLLFELLHPVLPIAPGLCAMSILTEVVRGGETLAIHKALCSLLRHHLTPSHQEAFLQVAKHVPSDLPTLRYDPGLVSSPSLSVSSLAEFEPRDMWEYLDTRRTFLASLRYALEAEKLIKGTNEPQSAGKAVQLWKMALRGSLDKSDVQQFLKSIGVTTADFLAKHDDLCKFLHAKCVPTTESRSRRGALEVLSCVLTAGLSRGSGLYSARTTKWSRLLTLEGSKKHIEGFHRGLTLPVMKPTYATAEECDVDDEVLWALATTKHEGAWTVERVVHVVNEARHQLDQPLLLESAIESSLEKYFRMEICRRYVNPPTMFEVVCSFKVPKTSTKPVVEKRPAAKPVPLEVPPATANKAAARRHFAGQRFTATEQRTPDTRWTEVSKGGERPTPPPTVPQRKRALSPTGDPSSKRAKESPRFSSSPKSVPRGLPSTPRDSREEDLVTGMNCFDRLRRFPLGDNPPPPPQLRLPELQENWGVHLSRLGVQWIPSFLKNKFGVKKNTEVTDRLVELRRTTMKEVPIWGYDTSYPWLLGSVAVEIIRMHVEEHSEMDVKDIRRSLLLTFLRENNSEQIFRSDEPLEDCNGPDGAEAFRFVKADGSPVGPPVPNTFLMSPLRDAAEAANEEEHNDGTTSEPEMFAEVVEEEEEVHPAPASTPKTRGGAQLTPRRSPKSDVMWDLIKTDFRQAMQGLGLNNNHIEHGSDPARWLASQFNLPTSSPKLVEVEAALKDHLLRNAKDFEGKLWWGTDYSTELQGGALELFKSYISKTKVFVDPVDEKPLRVSREKIDSIFSSISPEVPKERESPADSNHEMVLDLQED